MSRLAWLAAAAKNFLNSWRSSDNELRRERDRRIQDLIQEARSAHAEAEREHRELEASGSHLPPVEPPPIQSSPSEDDNDDEEMDLEILGRSGLYKRRTWDEIQQNAVRVVSSSNVYSYYFEPEPPGKSGILYVTFLFWRPGMKQEERSGAGSTYAYYNFPEAKYRLFEQESAVSAGKAVWDFCRVRHSMSDHQHTYHLVQSIGDYVPRKATRRGFAARTLVDPGLSPMERRRTLPRRSTLAPVRFANNGRPNRGAPNRGRPNRG